MNPDRAEEKKTEAMQFGTLVHEILLEGKYCDENGDLIGLVEKPDGMSYGSKEGQAWRLEQWGKGRWIIKPEEMRVIKMMMMTAQFSGLQEALQDGVPEVSFFWTDKSGVRCKIRPDKLNPICGYDLKTFENSMRKELEVSVAHAVANDRIHVAGYWYKLGLDELRLQIANNFDDAEAFRDVYFYHKDDSLRHKPADEEVRLIEEMNTEGHYPYWYAFLEKGGVPNVVIRDFRPKNPGQVELNSYWRGAKNSVMDATADYMRYMREYGEETPWIETAIMKAFDDLDFASAQRILEK